MAAEDMDVRQDGKAPSEIAVGRDAVSWLSEDAGRRLRKLEATAVANLKASEDGGKVLVDLHEGAVGGIEWAEFCVRAICALRTGTALDAQLPAVDDIWRPPLSTVEVPRDLQSFISGKAGARLLQFSDDMDVVAVFGQQAKVSNALSLEVGALIEAKYEGGNRWFEAKIVEVGKTTVRVKWTYDDDVPETNVPVEDCRASPQDAEKSTEASQIEVGALVEAKFGNKDRWFEAVVLRHDERTVKVKWTYDEDVPPSEVDRRDVRTKPKLPTDKLYILGPERGRLEAELKVLTLVEGKHPGFVSSRSRASDDRPGIGLSVFPLLNDGELKAKLIGKGGSVRSKISKACGTALEYIGNSAFVVGTQEERVHTAKLLELVQKSSNGAVEEIPKELEAVCTRIRVPQDASFMVTGKQRSNLNQVEEETRTLTFWSPDATGAPAKKEADLIEVGNFVQGRFKNRWFEATILEITKEENGDRSVKVRWDYDENEISTIPAADIREVSKDKAQEPSSSEARILAIFGPERPRKVAELQVMATVEMKSPGTYKDFKPPEPNDGFSHEVLQLDSQDAKSCGPKRLRAAAIAAHCILEQVGEVAHLAGTGAERARAREYFQWLAMDAPTVPEAASRPDIDVLSVPAGKRANLADHVVAPLEHETGTLVFFEGTGSGGVAEDARLFVCGHDSAKRAAALLKLHELQEKKAPPPKYDIDEDDSWGAPPAPKVVYTVSKEEEERRRKRAARFAEPPAKKR